MTDPSPQSSDDQPNADGRTCDICGDTVATVRRVALHGEYERLRTPHPVQYACPSCFEKKDRQRLGLERS
jgi:hypothetical protein